MSSKLNRSCVIVFPWPWKSLSMAIVGRWKSLSITEEEGEIVGIDDEMLEEGDKEAQSGILGKILTERPYRKTSFRVAIARMWKVEGGFTIREMANDVFLFLFGDEKERRRIFDMEPWVFDKYLIALKEVNGDDAPDWGCGRTEMGNAVEAFFGLGSGWMSRSQFEELFQ
ncbi:hypothetical protein TIFTF001_016823 [Ficus carica]|uniref:DUF4283 domain-containing protein n=1 Tax=Ficus carica TaxID=3494 RepID=A0AA88APK5_FICCA|nr:hypothetical protein TIFTF001_016823 [Ficus carica]